MTKTIKTLQFVVEDKYGSTINVEASITKTGNLYHWYISHLSKPQDVESVGFYRPSNTCSSEAEAENRIKSYINMMRKSKVVEYNTYY